MAFAHLNLKDKTALLLGFVLIIVACDDSKTYSPHCKTTKDCSGHQYCVNIPGLDYFCYNECDPTLDKERDCKDDPDCFVCGEDEVCNEYGKCIKKDEVMPCETDEDCPFDYPVCASFKNCSKCKIFFPPCPSNKVCNQDGFCINKEDYRPCEDDSDCSDEYPVCTYYKNCEKE